MYRENSGTSTSWIAGREDTANDKFNSIPYAVPGATCPPGTRHPSIVDSFNEVTRMQANTEGTVTKWNTQQQDVFSLKEGQVTLDYPARLSAESYEDLESWIQVELRKIKRSVIPPDVYAKP